MFVNEMHQGGIAALLAYDNTIFDGMQLPEGIDAQAVIDAIIFKYGSTPLAHPDPAIMAYYISSWSARRLAVWERYNAAINTEYDPLNNYDRYEKGTSTAENTISADNASIYQPDSKTVVTPDLHTYGNIGVTTSQQMLEAELNIVTRLDLINYIADDFRNEFCLDVY